MLKCSMKSWNQVYLYTTDLCVQTMHTHAVTALLIFISRAAHNHKYAAGQRIVRGLIRHDVEIVAYRTGRFHLSLYSYNSAAKIRNVLISENIK